MDLAMLAGLPVRSPKGEIKGYVTGFYLKRNALAALACADGGENEFFVPASAAEIGREEVLARMKRKSAPCGVPSPIGKSVFSRRGAFLGRVSGVLAEEGCAVVKGKIGFTFPLKALLFGDIVLLKDRNARKTG